MSDNGAYEDEMSEVALFESALRAAVPVQPRRELGASLVPRLAQAARASTLEAERVQGGGRTAAWSGPPVSTRTPSRVGIAVAASRCCSRVSRSRA